MAQTNDIQVDQRMRVANHYEVMLLSMALLRGDRLSGDQKGRIVEQALAVTSPEEFRNPHTVPVAAIDRLQQFLIQTVEAGRPRNMYGAEAARAAQASGPEGTRGAPGFGYIDAIRGSSARFRDLPAGDSVKGSGTSGSGVTPEFARSYAGSGVVGNTLQTFAEVGLDRGTFNAFRREGFSKEQIVDNARDSKVLGWHGRDDLSIAQHASTDVRKAAVATERAATPEQRDKCLKREQELEEKNDARPDSDPQKHHNRRFFERRHQDHQRHDAQAGLGTEARKHDVALPSPKEKAAKAEHNEQDGLMAKGRQASGAKLASSNQDDFGMSAEPTPTKPAPVKIAVAKPAAGPKPA